MDGLVPVLVLGPKDFTRNLHAISRIASKRCGPISMSEPVVRVSSDHRFAPNAGTMDS